MIKNCHFTNSAVEDLTAIWNYTFDNWSEKQADTYYDELLNACERIVENPRIGRNYENVVFSLLGLKVNSHVIFYRILDGEIEIARVINGQMDLKQQVF